MQTTLLRFYSNFQIQLFCVAWDFPSWSNLVGGHDVRNPVQEVADSDVDAVQVFVGAAFAPAHHAGQEPGFLVARDQGAPAVALAGIAAAGLQPGTQHVPGDVELAVESALLQGDPWQHQALKDGGWRTIARQAAPTGYRRVAHVRQRSADAAVLRREANGNHIEPQFYRAMKLQHGQVFVGVGLVVAGMDQHFDHLPMLLGLLNHGAVVLTFRGGDKDQHKGGGASSVTDVVSYPR